MEIDVWQELDDATNTLAEIKDDVSEAVDELKEIKEGLSKARDVLKKVVPEDDEDDDDSELTERLELIEEYEGNIDAMIETLKTRSANLVLIADRLAKARDAESDRKEDSAASESILEALRQRIFEHEHMANLRAEQGHEEYARVRRMCASDLEDVLSEVGELPGFMR